MELRLRIAHRAPHLNGDLAVQHPFHIVQDEYLAIASRQLAQTRASAIRSRDPLNLKSGSESRSTGDSWASPSPRTGESTDIVRRFRDRNFMSTTLTEPMKPVERADSPRKLESRRKHCRNASCAQSSASEASCVIRGHTAYTLRQCVAYSAEKASHSPCRPDRSVAAPNWLALDSPPDLPPKSRLSRHDSCECRRGKSNECSNESPQTSYKLNCMQVDIRYGNGRAHHVACGSSPQRRSSPSSVAGRLQLKDLVSRGRVLRLQKRDCHIVHWHSGRGLAA